ncbi:efflux RND transporter periplasmic adaptor subunit [Marinicella sp. W31]|uniref:efflux RND transporter periplasmic adaptor subunit n=1 Tax=Marinicella sp. W31 TaxID=3023713 RepID=UPI003757732E
MRILIIITIMVGIISLFYVNQGNGLPSDLSQPKLPPVVVEAVQAEIRPWVVSESFVGTVKSNNNVLLSAQTSGIVTQVHVTAGQKVKAEDVLLELDSSEIRAEIEKNKIDMEIADLELNRITQLQKKKIVTTSEWDKAKASSKRAKASLKYNQEKLAKHIIKAPFDGTVQINDVKAGSYVSQGQTLLPLIDNRELHVDFIVPARLNEALFVGSQIQVKSRFMRDSHSAAVVSVNDAFEKDSLNLIIRAQILSETELAGLTIGDLVEVSFKHNRDRQVLVIPEGAVNYRSYGENVFVVGADGVVDNKFIKTIGRMDNMAIVLFGIEAGERVVTAGQNKLYEGLTVQVKPPRTYGH